MLDHAMVHEDGLQQVQQRLQTVKLGHLLLSELHLHDVGLAVTQRVFGVLSVVHYWVTPTGYNGRQ